MKFSTSFCLVTVAIFALTIPSMVMAGKVYKWVDQDGNVHYGAEKPNSGAQELKVKTAPASSPSSASTSAESDKEKSRTAEEEKVKVSSEKEAAEVEKKNQEIRKKNCSIAKRRAATIEQGGRLYEVDESGERHYWDDDMRRAKMDEAEAQIKEWCN